MVVVVVKSVKFRYLEEKKDRRKIEGGEAFQMKKTINMVVP